MSCMILVQVALCAAEAYCCRCEKFYGCFPIVTEFFSEMEKKFGAMPFALRSVRLEITFGIWSLPNVSIHVSAYFWGGLMKELSGIDCQTIYVGYLFDAIWGSIWTPKHFQVDRFEVVKLAESHSSVPLLSAFDTLHHVSWQVTVCPHPVLCLIAS